ncbi:MAG TPA: AAA family ATPase [Isosphaeraceae bacterium]|jgi:hypothetical protein|nr:AAA family ATPase [Isosphaeraceae bacterium]
MPITPEDFGASFQGFMDQMASHKKAEEAPFFVRKLHEHLGAPPATLPIVSETFAERDHPNVHIALANYIAGEGRSADVLGVTGIQYRFGGQSLSELVAEHKGQAGGAVEGPVEYVNIPLEEGRVLACIKRGLFLIRQEAWPLVVFVREIDRYGSNEPLCVEVMAREAAAAEQFLRNLREMIRRCNVYRGHVLSLMHDGPEGFKVRFHRLPEVAEAAIILPEGLLKRIERQTVGFGRHSQRLRAAGRHLKRGILLYGPPGAGKTLTAMYLAGAMRDRTVLLMTGRGMGLIGKTCAMARALEPAIVIMEDVDLVAEERTRSGGATPILFELLNEIDGLADDVDILFLLTTNRPELLEPALASRPGRVDQAIEVPLPDPHCRRQLFALYGKGLTLQVIDLPRFIARTEGASGAFIRELLRKAALFAVDDSNEIVVADRHLDEALHELVVQGGDLTKSLLGFQTRVGFHDWSQPGT